MNAPARPGAPLRGAVSGRSARAATLIFVALIALALFSDVLKWRLPGGVALLISYAALAGLLFAALTARARRSRARSPAETTLRFGVAVVVGAYVFRALTTVETPIPQVGVGLAYIVLPLLLILALKRIAAAADPWTVLHALLIMMTPVQLVGFVQNFIDPQFLIFSTYTEGGGVITRAQLESGVFQRFPSIYSSSHRYSAVAALHANFAFFLLVARHDRLNPVISVWLLASFILGLAGTLLAGARVRVLLLGVALLTVLFVVMFFERRGAGAKSYLYDILRKYGVWLILGLVASAGYLASQFLVIDFLIDAIVQGDVLSRVNDAIYYSRVRQETSLFGSGVGSLTPDGTPGEFGIRAIWIEMGVVVGSIVIFGYLAVLVGLWRAGVQALALGDGGAVCLLVYPALVILGGLLTGLKFSAELSTGVLLAVSIAFAFERLRHVSAERLAARRARARWVGEV